jgi:hypothetical protein
MSSGYGADDSDKRCDNLVARSSVLPDEVKAMRDVRQTLDVFGGEQ